MKNAVLRVCMSCEWIYKSDGSCPLCDWPSYGAHSVYGNQAYEYHKNQTQWKQKKLDQYESELNRFIKENNDYKEKIKSEKLLGVKHVKTIK